MEDVYATARGPLARVASPLAARARARRHARFFGLARLPPGARVLDLGCGRVGLRALEPGLDITGVDIVDRPDYAGTFVRADAAAGLPFAADEFDLVYCSSVIEHVPPARRPAFAAEVRRVGRGWYVQAPAGLAVALPGQAADVVAEPVEHEEHEQDDPHGAEAVHAGERDPPAAHLLCERPQHVAPVERQERKQVDHRQHQRDEAQKHERVARTRRDRFVRDLGYAHDAMEFVAHLFA